MASQEEREEVIRRHAPALVLWPEIPAAGGEAGPSRDHYAFQRVRRASRVTSGAHVLRDFHPRDVRLVLDNAQAWEPTPPLPLVPIAFTRAYRDYARFLFWPLLALVLLSLVLATLAQGLPPIPRDALEIGAFVFVAALYVLTLRSPILVPVDHWHHLNHLVVGIGVVVMWAVIFGTQWLWLAAPIIAIPTAFSVLTSVALAIAKGLATIVLGLIQWVRGLFWEPIRHPTRGLRHREPRGRLFPGVKPAHEYGEDAELFYRSPRTREPIHRANRAAHWSAYGVILARNGYPRTMYARYVEPDASGIAVVQYWFCYYYNDWANEHEADWEMASVLLKDGQPLGVAVSQHESGEVRDWGHVELQGDRPVLYVAAGSHAFYFEPGAYLTERALGGMTLTSLDAALLGREILDFVDFTPTDPSEWHVADDMQVIVIPEPDPNTGHWGHQDHDPSCGGQCDYNFEWLNFPGHWGAVALTVGGGSSGPRGPAYVGLDWDNPRMWTQAVCRPCRACAGESAGALELGRNAQVLPKYLGRGRA